MDIVKTKPNNYYAINVSFLKDKNLSLKAKGFLAILYTEQNTDSCIKESNASIDAVMSELIMKGYCKVIEGDKYELLDLTDNCSTLQRKEVISVSKKPKKDVPIALWRENINEYKKQVAIAEDRLVSDTNRMAKFITYYPNGDWDLSIRKMVDEFWNTEEAWEYCKKKRKANDINMFAALSKSIMNRSNIVYKPFGKQKMQPLYSEPKKEEYYK